MSVFISILFFFCNNKIKQRRIKKKKAPKLFHSLPIFKLTVAFSQEIIRGDVAC